ncbi:MAG TPA: sugar transferase [Steroidobacteraceae bacterium]|nr:sugar transferase [Steroidobacteraceae bacterium]
MLKRSFDFLVALVGLLVSSVIIVPVAIAVWFQDFKSPFYMGPRVARGGGIFRMAKLRSMVVKADKTGVDSTGANDPRITPIGKFIRAYKLDELTQLWNVLKGDMSLVGPRPNVERETRMYTGEEQRLLSVRPGITDYASIVFADEGEILRDKADPDIAYNQLIRPYKSQLGIFYVEHRNLLLDFKLIFLTALAMASRQSALRAVVNDLRKRGAPEALVAIAARSAPLQPAPPPGATSIVTERY